MLPGRRTIVVTRNPDWRHEGVNTARTLAEALAEAVALAGPDTDVMVVGGGEIYAQAMPLAARLEITQVFADADGDTVFPAINPAEWQEARREERDGHAFVTYVRL